jgi:hypothetical protein
MKKHYFSIALCLFMAAISTNLSAQVSSLLDIPGRLQWDNANGYCGETSIQMIALYYGNYISQDVCRTVAGGEVLIGDDNGEVALDNLSFTIDEWDYNQATPQYQNYLIWAKQHLYNNHPVIITVFVQGMSDPYYDHIIPAIGFTGADVNSYNNTDELMFNDCYDASYYTRTFQSIWDTRSMSGNGATYEYCIPRDEDYGCAVTGIKDDQHVTRPVHLTLDRWDEPNVTLGESAELVNATITIDSLTIGEKYALLRYNNYTLVPSTGFDPAGANTAIYFTASATTATFSDSFMSNTSAFYRCIPYDYSSLPQQTLTDDDKFIIYPNPAKDILTIESPENTNIEIINSQGQTVKSITSTGLKCFIDINELADGIYTIRMKTDKKIVTQKFIKK